jgi:glyoxylate reductase
MATDRDLRVHVTRPIPDQALDYLKDQGFEVTCPSDDGPPSREELLSSVKDVDALLSILTEKIDGEVFERADRLKVVSNMAVGYDNIDVLEATRHGVAVCNTPGVLTDTTADFAWALLMAVARRVVECHRFVRDGRWEWWGPKMMMGTDVHGKTLGIVGFGKIGQAVARRAKGFEMDVVYSGETAPETSEWGRKVSFEELLQNSDFVSLHVPYRSSTHHLIGKDELHLMKKTAFLINTARGAVVDEEQLVEALESGEIAGAGLDVFEKEPQVHPGLHRPNVVLAPHAASASLATRTRMANMAAENLVAVLHGEEPRSIVNPEVLEQCRNPK